MTLIAQRSLLLPLAITGFITGMWAYLWPRHWYDTFPGVGLRWLPSLGPYNPHVAAEVGALYLGLALLAVLAIVHITNAVLVRASAGAWTIFNLLHVAFHLRMLHMYDVRDQILTSVALSAVLLASLGALLGGARRQVPPTGAEHVR